MAVFPEPVGPVSTINPPGLSIMAEKSLSWSRVMPSWSSRWAASPRPSNRMAKSSPWSVGMTLREMAALMRSLGATEAINLDGGGSTALVVRDSSGSFRPANRPSDPTGERPVANALAVVRDSACVRAH